MRVSMSPRGSVNGMIYTLPAGLRETGDEALVAQLPDHDPRQSEFAIIGARSAGQAAAVAHPSRVPVARDLGELQPGDQPLGVVPGLVVRDRLQPGIFAGIFLDELLATLVLVDRTQFRHDLSSLPSLADRLRGLLLVLVLREGEVEE